MSSLPIIEEIQTAMSPEALVSRLEGEPGVVLLHSSQSEGPQRLLQDSNRQADSTRAEARYSFVTARPFLVFRSRGSLCRLDESGHQTDLYGNPWRILDSLISRYELLEALDLPFPLGGCFGFWGYDLKHFVEPNLARRAVADLNLPDCHVGFHGSLVVMDHHLGKTWVISVGMQADGSRCPVRARAERDFWVSHLLSDPAANFAEASMNLAGARPVSTMTREGFLRRVQRAQDYIQTGDVYQVNLAQRLSVPLTGTPWQFYRRLTAASPAPFSAWVDGGDIQIASSSPELFLRLSGSQIRTRPIKGTRPRSNDPTRDAQLTYELQTSTKEMAELIMITDLLRNDLGRVCDFGTVEVPELVRLERYAQVQHLVSTVEGRLRPEITHFLALASCFPGGSITGAPKIRAMDIIDELEPVTRGPYTGCVGFLGFNRESQLSILIRAGVCLERQCHFHVGAGIVADSDPEAEYEETLAKAGGFLEVTSAASHGPVPRHPCNSGPGKVRQP